MRLASMLAALLSLGQIAAAETVLENVVGRYLAQAEKSGETVQLAPAREKSPWKITGSVGGTVTTGNSEAETFFLGLTAEREFGAGVWKLKLGWNSVYARTEGVESASEHILQQRLDHKLNDISTVFEELMAEHDEAEKLTVRIIVTLGYKRQIVKRKNFLMTAEVGLGVLHEEFRTRLNGATLIPETDNTEFIGHLGFDFEWKLTATLVFSQSFRLYPSITESGDFNFASISNFTLTISAKVKLVLKLIDRFDSDAVAPTTENDLVVALTLSFSF